MPLQFDTKDAMRFIGKNTKGAQVVLDLGDKKVSAIVKDIDYNSMQRQIMSLDFQALVKGEKISTSVPVKFENAEKMCIRDRATAIPLAVDNGLR